MKLFGRKAAVVAITVVIGLGALGTAAFAAFAPVAADTFTLVCQVNGKVRDRVPAPTGAAREELEALCLETSGVQAHVDGHEIAKVVVVPDKLVNVVVR